MRRLVLLGGLLTVAALVLSSCTSSAAPGDTLAALNIMDSADFHAIDTGLAAPGAKIDATWLGKTRNARIAVAATTWPKDLQPQAKAFVEASGKLQEALEKDDVAGAAAPARETHEAQHELSADAYTYLAGKAGIAAAKHDDGH